MSEDILQAEIYKWYHNEFCTKATNPKHIIFSVPNGAHVSKAQAMKLKATGLVAGVSDLIILQPNKAIFVELKTEKGRQSDNQKEFEQIVTALGFDYHLVRSLDDFKNIFL